MTYERLHNGGRQPTGLAFDEKRRDFTLEGRGQPVRAGDFGDVAAGRQATFSQTGPDLPMNMAFV